jgi:hypothetical protein
LGFSRPVCRRTASERVAIPWFPAGAAGACRSEEPRLFIRGQEIA